MTVQEAYDILTKLHGYTGPETKRSISNFINARDIPIAVKNRGGMIGMSTGGGVDDRVMLEGQPPLGPIPDDLRKFLEEEKDKKSKDEPYTAEDIQEGQRKLIGDATIDPSKTLKKPDVDKIDPETKGTLIGTGVTRDYKEVSAEAAGFKPPPPGQPVTMALETFHNPTTGEVVTVGSGGFTPPEGFVRGSPEGRFTEPAAGQVSPDAPKADIAQVGTTSQADDPTATPVTKATTTTSAEKMKKLMDNVDPQTGKVTKEVVGQTKEDTAVSDLDAAQIGTPQTVKDAPTRKAEVGEMLSETPVVDQTRVAGVDAQAVSVQDELSTLMSQFDDGKTPAWAAGSMRKAMQTLAARGLGASSLAGQAVIQAAMESALPIAQIDASNKQQVALANAQQRAKFLQIEFDQAFQTKVMNAAKVSEIANMNFTAQQQVALENARMAQTVDLNNLSNRQALVMAEAAQLSQLEMAGLSNLQQAQIANAQNFLQMDLTNLNNEQQTELFKAQQNAQTLLTDTASQNATEQFNASSANQSAQFDANLASQVSQFNTAQYNAMSQFNVNEENALNKFNAEIQNQRDFFNANNSLVVAQANAKWRQDTTTVNTATQNQANFEFAKQINGLSNKAIDQIWQRERDLMQFAVAQSESALERSTRLLLADKKLDSVRMQLDTAEDAARTSFFGRMLFGSAGLSIFGTKGLLGLL